MNQSLASILKRITSRENIYENIFKRNIKNVKIYKDMYFDNVLFSYVNVYWHPPKVYYE